MKRCLLVAILFAFVLSSCQKESEVVEDNHREVKQLEEKLGVQLKTATRSEVDGAIFIPYEDLMKMEAGKPAFGRYEFKAQFLSPGFDTFRNYIANVTFCVEPLLKADIEINFINLARTWRFTMNNQFDLSSYTIYHMGKAFPTLGSMMEKCGWDAGMYNIKFSSQIYFTTKIGNVDFVFTGRIQFDLKYTDQSETIDTIAFITVELNF